MQDYNYQKDNGEKSYDSVDGMQEIFERLKTMENTLMYLISKVDNIEKIVMKLGDK